MRYGSQYVLLRTADKTKPIGIGRSQSGNSTGRGLERTEQRHALDARAKVLAGSDTLAIETHVLSLGHIKIIICFGPLVIKIPE